MVSSSILRLMPLFCTLALQGFGACGARGGLHGADDSSPGATQREAPCAASPLEIARAAPAVDVFLEIYGVCDGCNPDYAKGVEDLIGCVSTEVQGECTGGAACDDQEWTVLLWVGDACSFRFGASQEKLSVRISKQSCQVIVVTPDDAYILDSYHCESNADCVCLSGSGLPFVGCRNSFHGPLWMMGSYRCEQCTCREGSCATH